MDEIQHEDDELIRRALLSSCPTSDRVAAVRLLANSASDKAVDALVVLATRDEAPELAHAVGETLAGICFRRAQDIDDLLMADMSEGAYLGYDEAISRLLTAHPSTRMRHGRIGSRR
jgi:hypothetical protein